MAQKIELVHKEIQAIMIIMLHNYSIQEATGKMRYVK